MGDPQSLPPALQYAPIQTLQGVTSKDLARYYPSNGLTFVAADASNVEIQIVLPPGDSILDIDTAVLEFTVSTGDTTNQATYANGFNFIRRIQIATPDAVLEDVDFWNRQANVTARMAGEDWTTYTGNVSCGTGMIATGMHNFNATNTRQFALPLYGLGLFHGGGKMLPLPMIRKPIMLRIFLENQRLCAYVTDAGAQATFTFTQVQFSCNRVRFEDSFMMLLKEELLRQGFIRIHTVTTQVFQQSIAAGTTTANIIVPVRARVRSIVGWFAIDADQDRAHQSFSTALDALTSYQFQYGATPLPSQPVLVTATQYADAYARLLECYGMLNDVLRPASINGIYYVAANGNPDKRFAFGYDFRAISTAGPFANNNMDMLSAPQQLTLRLTSGAKAASSLYLAAAVDCTYEITADGDIRVYI